ncbi:hypothetical protein BS47DRAFT_1347819 [Hydnum rufescens UP504]|uniref:Phosphoglycerate mutase n=1 Tax=Hydnum rufescens UP504 TaxID=1448309 RepID=A0A9P6DR25_9AGAM|nr:hypothetical protein BS47DRAFT_1347819 [Hydnum rufescens UP504]
MASYWLIHFLRHLEAEHNVNHDGTSDNIQATANLLVTSPFTRTLQTTQIALPKLKSRLEAAGQKLIVLSRLQEKVLRLVTLEKAVRSLRKRKSLRHRFSSLEDDWNVKVGDFAPENVVSRAKWVRKWLRARPEREIVVVSHANFLRAITNTDRSNYWGNGEIRSFTFVEDDDEDAVLQRIT